jgi:hypothetical protein
MSFYSNLQGKAGSLLAKFGQDVTLRRITVGAYDSATSASSVTPADTVYKGALFDIEEGTKEIRGELVQATDKQMLLGGAASPAPTNKDVVLVAGVQYGIISSSEINPAGTAVLYELHLRK